MNKIQFPTVRPCSSPRPRRRAVTPLLSTRWRRAPSTAAASSGASAPVASSRLSSILAAPASASVASHPTRRASSPVATTRLSVCGTSARRNCSGEQRAASTSPAEVFLPTGGFHNKNIFLSATFDPRIINIILL